MIKELHKQYREVFIASNNSSKSKKQPIHRTDIENLDKLFKKNKKYLWNYIYKTEK